MLRRALSLFVTLAMVLGMCPAVGIAEEPMEDLEGGPAAEGQVVNSDGLVAQGSDDGNDAGVQAEENYVASVTVGGTTTPYDTFDAALNAWDDGCTLTLLADVTTPSTISVPSGTKTFDLGGCKITKTGDAGSVFCVRGGSLTVNGPGTISGGQGMNDGENQDYYRGGGFHVSSGSVTVENVTISDNDASWGGGVFLSGGTFTMKNSTITNNRTNACGKGQGATWNEGGAAWIQGGTFIMDGGTITGNATTDGKFCGVAVSSGTFKVLGKAVIADNKDGNQQKNFSGTITVDGELVEGANIGVTHSPSVFTNTAEESLVYNDATKFASDNPDYAVGKNSGGQLFLGTRIDSVAVTDIDTPEATKDLDKEAATATENVTLKDSGAIAWEPAAPQDGKAAYATQYTATVIATVGEDYAFADNATATVNGEKATVTKNADGTLSVSCTFPKTALEPVEIGAQDKSATYSAEGIAIPVDGMFSIPEGAGEATYSVVSATGEGTYADGRLMVAKCGTFKVGVKTAANDTHLAGEATATLTVNKAASSVAKAPEATNPTYNGKAQELVKAGEAEGGTMQYSLDGKTFSADIPTGTGPGSYDVWYKVVGDANHNDTEAQKVTSTITKDDPKPATHRVTLAGGANATTSGGATAQDVEDGKAMATVTYVANEGFHFDAFDPIKSNGVSATFADGKVVVSGTPTADVKITVPDAVADPTPAPTPEPVPAAPSVTYAGHVQGTGDLPAVRDGATLGTTGESRRLEQISASVSGIEGASITYRAHLQRTGWTAWEADGGKCGTTGEARCLEAVQMRLSGADGYHVWYRVHSQTWGWLGWAKDGQPAGTAGQSKRGEALEVRVLPEGADPAAELADYVEGQASYVGAATADVHLQKVGWTGARSALTFGATGESRRLEAVSLSLENQPVSGGIEYDVHLQTKGWEDGFADGQVAGTVGESRRLEAVRIRLNGEMATSGQFSVWYRVHSQTYGWLGWAKDGEEAGTTGLSKRGEALEVQILPSGQVPDGYDAGQAASIDG